MSKRILVVDDNLDTVTALQQVLEKAGYAVEVARNGEEGCTKTLSSRPDLILLDIMMPIMDGYTMNQKLKENPETRDIPVIIISARSGMAPVFKAQKGPPIQGYLVKPVSSKVLLLKIDEVFKGSAA